VLTPEPTRKLDSDVKAPRTAVRSSYSPSDAEALLRRCAAPAQRWFFLWLAAFGIGFLVRLTLALTASSADLRLESRVGALTLLAGLVGTLALTPRTAFAAAKLARQPEIGAEQRRTKHELAHRLLTRGLFWERFGRSAVPHVAGACVNVTAGLYLCLGAQLLRAGVFAIVAGVIVNTLKILTQPMTATEALGVASPSLST
jgi:hypothetical protein